MTNGYQWTQVCSDYWYGYKQALTWNPAAKQVIVYGQESGQDTFFINSDLTLTPDKRPLHPPPARTSTSIAIAGNILFSYQGGTSQAIPDLWGWNMQTSGPNNATWLAWSNRLGSSYTGTVQSDMISYNGTLYEFGGMMGLICQGALYRLTLNYSDMSYVREPVAFLLGRAGARLVLVDHQLYVLGGYCEDSVTAWEAWYALNSIS